jgi:hypothetical protein
LGILPNFINPFSSINSTMQPIPVPSHVHYELLLQLLERQTWVAVEGQSVQREQVHQLIATLRKALAQQRQLEQSCERSNLPVEYRWSLNQDSPKER